MRDFKKIFYENWILLFVIVAIIAAITIGIRLKWFTQRDLSLIVFSGISAIAVTIVAIYTYKQHKMHYDSELTGFVKKFDGVIFEEIKFGNLGGLGKSKPKSATECTLVNSGGVPITIENISYNFKNSKNKVLYSEKKVTEFYSPRKSEKLYINKTPWIIKGGDMVICIIPFDWFMDSREHIVFLPSEFNKVDKIEINFDYLVYKTPKRLFLTYFLNKNKK